MFKDQSLAQQAIVRQRTTINLQNFRQGVTYLIKRALMILLTIFVGVFITIVIINRPVNVGLGIMPPQLDSNLERNIQLAVRNFARETPGFYSMPADERNQLLEDLEAELIAESGLNDPPLIKNLHWTWNALKFDWGRIAFTNVDPLQLFWNGSSIFTLNDILLQYLPTTLLLVAASYLIIFIFGIPLALFLSQNSNKWYDRLISMIAPISSIPSWVIAIILIAIFAVELKWFPISGILDTFPPENKWEYILIIGKHMVLPVTAIVLSLFFQMVYSWRTIFVTFGDEDYVDLGKSIGLPPKQLRKDYLLKPTLPYVITSFSLTLISFWQMTMALETVFRWEGIGWLYVNVGLPNFWGESMYPGELIIALSLVVLFAYLLGIVVFLLDIVYVFVDPRIKLKQKNDNLSLRAVQRQKGGLRALFSRRTKPVKTQIEKQKSKITFKDILFSIRYNFSQFKTATINFFREMKKFPSAVFGFSIIILLLLGSIYAVFGLPYQQIGEDWGKTTLSGRAYVPKLGKPVWTNFFRKTDYLSTMILNDDSPEVRRIETVREDGTKQISIIYEFAYPYADFPSEIDLYLQGIYDQKKSFTSVTWTTPDGRQFNLNGVGVDPYTHYDFDEYINAHRIVSKNENWKQWFNFGQVFPTPFFYVLFANPDAATEELVNGVYELRLDVITFEPDSDIQSELVVLGHVYGIFGTDYFRRDLTVPLFWGMPFALIVGLLGSVLTTVLSMIIAAAGVWFGGWVDDIAQRLTEVNMILPVIAISVLAYAYLHINIWYILIFMVLLNVFGAPLKSFRSVLLQVKEAPYIEAATAYGAKSFRIIMKYMVPRIIPVLVPQLIILIPSFVFLEATLGLFNIDSGLPTWGTMIYQGLTKGALYGSRYWVLEPLFLLILTGTAFSMFGSALERILNPRLLDK